MQQNALGKLNGKVQEMYTGFNEIKLYGKEEDSIKEFKKVNQELCENGFKAQFISSMMNPMVSLVTYFGIAAVAVVGSIYAVSGGITVGNLQAFVLYMADKSATFTNDSVIYSNTIFFCSYRTCI